MNRESVVKLIPMFLTLLPACSISSGLIEVGAIDRDQIEMAIHSRAPEYKKCREECMGASPEQCTGKVVLEWNVRDDGSVGEVTVKSSTLHSEKMVACVESVIEKTTFKPVQATLHISYPFIFTGKLTD